MKKLLTILLSVVLVATLCCAAACQGHTWDTEWSSDKDNHWHACLDEGCDEKSDVAPHVDADHNDICDVCKYKLATTQPTDPCANGHTVATWTDAGNGKHSGECSVCHETITENHVGTETCTKCGATLGGTVTPPVGTTYTIYYYAPAWPKDEAVYVYTYAGADDDYPLGEIGQYGDNPLTAVTGKAGWYSVDFTTEVEFGTLRIIFYTADDDKTTNENAVKHEFYVEGVTGTSLYFIANANNIYTSEAAAEDAYNAIANGTTPELPDPAEDEVRLTLYVHVNTEKVPGSTVYMYSWVGNDKPLGEWPGVEMTPYTVDGSSDWYLLEANVKKTYTAFALIVNMNGTPSEQYDAVTSFSMDDNGKYIGKYKDIIDTSVENVLAKETEYENSKGDPISITVHVQLDLAKAGKGPYYIYAWATGKDELFGGWTNDNNILTAEEGHDGWYSLTIEIDDSLLGVAYNYQFHGTAQYNSATITLTADNLEVWITSANVASFTAPTGYDTSTDTDTDLAA